jgi:asparagine synthase (glutamine-hydrolysing)
MCGMVGIWTSKTINKGILNKAVRSLAHRGPDDSDSWFDESAGLGLGFVRLSIQDLSLAGHQPMHSACGRYLIAFNGEIYNHLALREQIGEHAPAWRGHSDTETLLACFIAWGVKKTLKATVGMFAIALWDRQEKKLVLARDRMGEKPLYYGYVGGAFVFASELKALSGLPGFSGDIDRGALALLMRHNYIPAPHSIYQGLYKLLPGMWLEMSADAALRQSLPSPQLYWSAVEAAFASVNNPLTFASDEQAVNALETELVSAIAGQMAADVPLGAFLSGGVDSSAVVALMQAQSKRPVKTFSIGIKDESYDEAIFARSVARHLGTEHTELYVSAEDSLGIIPRMSTLYDEPFSDSSQIPTFLVAQLARQKVTVSLSGDGGDELFGGYNRYTLASRTWERIDNIPLAMRRALSRIILGLSPTTLDRLCALAAPFIPKSRRWPALVDKLHKGAVLLNHKSSTEFYRELVSHCNPADIVLGANEPITHLSGTLPSLFAFTEQMMLLDTISYLPDDILVKLDRASMAVSLETRVPLIDHRVFEFAWRLPMQYKIRDGTSKWLLRQVLYKYVPRELIERPKMGFSVPIDNWLRGPLRGWAESLLDESRLRQEGYFNSARIVQKWQEHQSGKRNWQYLLWNVLMFQTWLQDQRR